MVNNSSFELPPPTTIGCGARSSTWGVAIITSPAGVLVRTPFDGCYSRATRDSLNDDEHVLALVGLTETLVCGAYARAFCFARDKTKYFC